MNENNLSQIFAHYIDKFEMINDAEHAEYYKWQICSKFKPLMDAALQAEEEDFADALYQAKACSENIIDSYTQPFYGLVQFARKEPETVRQMFRDLYADDGGNPKKQMECIEKFFTQSNALLEKYFPGSHLYKQNSHSVSSYLFLYDPDHHYMYKATQSQAMADCIGFYDDWGSGDNIKLDVYYRMCDQILKEIQNCPELLATNRSRYDGALRTELGELHPDGNLHILLFDIIYCCNVYDLFDGISFSRPKSKEKRLIVERKNQAERRKADYDAAKKEAEQLEEAKQYFVALVREAGRVSHKKFGRCDVLSVNPAAISLKPEGAEVAKKFDFVTLIANGIIHIDSAEFEAGKEKYLAVIKKSGLISRNLECAAKALAPYEEFL